VVSTSPSTRGSDTESWKQNDGVSVTADGRSITLPAGTVGSNALTVTLQSSRPRRGSILRGIKLPLETKNSCFTTKFTDLRSVCQNQPVVAGSALNATLTFRRGLPIAGPVVPIRYDIAVYSGSFAGVIVLRDKVKMKNPTLPGRVSAD